MKKYKKISANLFLVFALMILLSPLANPAYAENESEIEIADVFVKAGILTVKLNGLNEANRDKIEITLNGEKINYPTDGPFVRKINIPSTLVIRNNIGTKYEIKNTFHLLFEDYVYIPSTIKTYDEDWIEVTDVFVEDGILTMIIDWRHEENKATTEITLNGVKMNYPENGPFVAKVDFFPEEDTEKPWELAIKYNIGTNDQGIRTFYFWYDNFVYTGDYKIEELKLNYMYVEDGVIYTNFAGLSPAKLSKLKFIVNDKTLETGLVSNIETTIPGKIKYEYNGIVSETYHANLYNEVIYGEENMPLAIKKRLNSKSMGDAKKVEGFKNVVKEEFGTKINVYDVFYDYIKELFR